MKYLKPGGTFRWEIPIHLLSMGGANAADSLPTAAATHNGVADAAFTFTVAPLAIGHYLITGTVPRTYTAGDDVAVTLTAVIEGVTRLAIKECEVVLGDTYTEVKSANKRVRANYYPFQRLVDECQGAGWTLASGNGALTTDHDDPYQGSQSLRLTTGTNATASTLAYQPTGARVFNGGFGLTMRSSNPAWSSCVVKLFPTATDATAYYTITISADFPKLTTAWRTYWHAGGNGMTAVGSVAAWGTAVSSVAIEKITIAFTATNGQAMDVEIGGLWTNVPSYPIPFVLYFDDGYSSVYTTVFPALETAGIKATFALNCSNIGTAGYMTWSQVNEMAAAGHDIVTHGTPTHQSASSGTAATLIGLMEANLKLLRDNCPIANLHYGVWPYNAGDTTDSHSAMEIAQSLGIYAMRGLASQGGNASATSFRGFVGSLTSEKRQWSAASNISSPSQSDFTGLQALIDKRLVLGGAAIYYGHKVVPTLTEPSDSDEVTTTLFSALVAYLGAKQTAGLIQCMTASQFGRLALADQDEQATNAASASIGAATLASMVESSAGHDRFKTKALEQSSAAVDASTTATKITAIDTLTKAGGAGDLADVKQKVGTTGVVIATAEKASIVSGVWAALTSSLTTVGSVGKWLYDNMLNAASRTGSFPSAALVNVPKTGYSLTTEEKAGLIALMWSALTTTLTTSGSIGKWIADRLAGYSTYTLPAAAITRANGRIDPTYLTAYQHCRLRAAVAVVDADDVPIDLAGKTLSLVAWPVGEPETAGFALSSEGDSPALSYSGDTDSTLVIDAAASTFNAAGQYDYRIYDATSTQNLVPLVSGVIKVEAGRAPSA